MTEFIKLQVSVTLKHILDKGPKLANDNSDDSDQEAEDQRDSNGLAVGSSRRRLVAREGTKSKPTSDQLLDFEGPKLITGLKNWLFFYQLIGQINFIGKPLYISIIFKLSVLLLTSYILIFRFLYKFSEVQVVDGSFKNPIFMFISCLAVVGLITQILVTFYVNLFDLCPMYKILITPRLCFLNTETQHIIGTRALSAFLIIQLYNTVLISMAANRSWTDFVNQFNILTFLLDFYAITVFIYYLLGLTQIDLYIRCSFGYWLLALKSHLERQFTYLHRYQRRSLRLNASSESLNSSLGHSQASKLSHQHNKSPQMRLITLDEIQKNLNHMDDHLEVLRSIQISTLVLVTLNAFLGNGALFLLTYHLLADQSNYYHGFLFLLLSFNFMFGVFISYSGDRWVFYALSSFVQTVEDEYFMQSDIKALDLNGTDNNNSNNELSSGDVGLLDEPTTRTSHDLGSNHLMQQILLIKKKDVLFCREFLHQFENHLATPWSKLTFKSHLHMLRAFVTLVAAQIIFDNEH